MSACELGWSSVVTWSLVLLGWFAVHTATLARDRRKEKREAAERICEALLNAQAAAIDFHTSKIFDQCKSIDLAQLVERIIIQLQVTPLSELDTPKSRLVSLRQSVTQRNIDLSDFAPQSPDSELLLSIRISVSELVLYIETRREVVWK